jgi:tetratricopeptide (TPR) repeat protein/predicted Ser/Thr protein kinase
MIGKTIDRYKVIDKLGEGGMGSVWKAEDPKLNRLVALKTLSPHMAENEEARKRFTREAQAASALNHPNITTVHDLLDFEDQHFICMEYIEGKTIRDMVESGRVGVKKAVDIILQAAEALGAAHRKGILHRDVKSANIMVSMEGNVKVMDFGLAHLEERSQLTRTGTTMGTLAYSSPEQLTGQPYDERSEIWSLGVVFYELLTGQLPFQSPSEGELLFSIINNEQDPVSTSRTDIPESVDVLLTRMLDKDPALRPQNCGELISSLRIIREELGTSTVQMTAAQGLKKPRLRTRLLLIAAVVVLALIVVSQVQKTTSDRMDLRTVLVLIENPSGEEELEGYRWQAVEYIIRGIEQTQSLKVVPYTDVFHYWKMIQEEQPRDHETNPLRVIADYSKAGVVIGGTCRVENDSIRFNLDLRESMSGTLLYQIQPIIGLESQFTQLQNDLRIRVLGALGSHLKQDYDIFTDQAIYAPSPEAFRHYQTGIDAFLRAQWDPAVAAFTDAWKADPNWTIALLALARSWSAQSGVSGELGDEIYLASIARDSVLAVLEDFEDNFSPMERLTFEALKHSATGDYAARYQVDLEALEIVAPGSRWAYEAGRDAVFLRKCQEAVEHLSQIDRDSVIGRKFSSFWWIWTLALDGVGDYEGLIEAIRQAEFVFSPDPVPLWIANAECRALAALGREDDVLEWLENRIQLGNEPYTFGAELLLSYGHEEAAGRFLELARQWYLEQITPQNPLENHEHDWQLGYGYILYLSGDIDQSQQIYQRLEREHPSWIVILGRLGIIAARKGNVELAANYDNRLEELSTILPGGLCNLYRAGIAARLGDIDEGVEYLNRSFKQGYFPTYDWHAKHDLEPLRNHPRLQRMVRGDFR